MTADGEVAGIFISPGESPSGSSMVNIHTFYAPILARFRKSRMATFARRFAIDQHTSVLDMGGGAFNWTLVENRPRLTILDKYEHSSKVDWADYVVGDGCKTGFETGKFDVVFSNSVIEHVGGVERQREFAAECMRCGRGFFVQTPNKWFPFDPHTLMPFAHWLPQRWFRKLIRFSPRFLLAFNAVDFEDFSNMRLLSRKNLQELFPGAEIIEEKFCGITKSLIAVSAVPCPDQRTVHVACLSSSDRKVSDR
jgi:Methyltransferase domain